MQRDLERERGNGKDVRSMAKALKSIMDNLKQIFGMVYQEAPAESVEESEENED